MLEPLKGRGFPFTPVMGEFPSERQSLACAWQGGVS
jgi:hypothetical protein